MLTHFSFVDIFLPLANMNLFAHFIKLLSKTMPHVIFPLTFVFSAVEIDVCSLALSLVIFKLSVISFLCCRVIWIRSVELHIPFTILFPIFPAAFIFTQIWLNEFTFTISLSFSPLSFVQITICILVYSFSMSKSLLHISFILITRPNC